MFSSSTNLLLQNRSAPDFRAEMAHNLENDPTAIALNGNHLTPDHSTWAKEKKKRNWLRKILILVACLLFFTIGILSGYFIPRNPVSQPEADQFQSSPTSFHSSTTSFQSSTTSFQSSTTSNLIPPTASTPDDTTWRSVSCPASGSNKCPKGYRDRPPLLVVSADGFRAEYLSRGLTPALDRIRSCGASAPSMRPTHPAITFPNHYSIATGLYAESHGIVDNTFYDPVLKAQFNYKNPVVVGQSRWWNGEPIWVTAKKHGKRANTYFWVGSEAEIHGFRPDVWLPFNASHPFETRVDEVIKWLSAPDSERPDVTMLYFEEPDSAGHRYGTQSSNVNASLTRTSSMVDRLMQGLYERDLLSCINVILVSDHGMEDADCDKAFYLMDILQKNPSTSSITTNDIFVYGGVQARISLKTNSSFTTDDLYNSLQCPVRNASDRYPVFQTYKKEHLPRRLHYSNTNRVEPLVMNVNARSSVFASQSPSYICTGPSGMHGYDNLYYSQQSIFMAMGPSIRFAVEIEPFRNVELYNFMCDLLDVPPAPNNGTYGSLHGLLRERKPVPRPNELHPTGATFPKSEEELNQRSDTTCSPDPACFANGYSAHDADLQLNISDAESAALLGFHAPYGIPRDTSNSSKITVLVNVEKVVAYDVTKKMTIWTSFRLHSNQTFQNPHDLNCLRTDIRLGSSEKLTCQAITNLSPDVKLTNLVPPGLEKEQNNKVQLVSNVVPMYETFRNGSWKTFWNMIGGWTTNDWKLNVQLGPVFELAAANITTILPSASFATRLPSHFYVIVTRDNRKPDCTGKECLSDVLAFLLPHLNETQQCQDDRTYILTHSATVTDIESVTSLRFFTDLPVYEGIRLRTQLPVKLWDSQTGL